MTAYNDDNDIPDWARAAAEKAEVAGFGRPSGGRLLFDPRGVMTRAEFVTALDKFGLLDHLPTAPVSPEPEPIPEPEPEPEPWRGPIPGTPRTDLTGKWTGGNNSTLANKNGGYVSIDNSTGVWVYNYFKQAETTPQRTDGLVIAGYTGNVHDVTIEHAYIGGRPVREPGKHVDTVQIWAQNPHTVSDVTFMDSILEGSANAALMVKGFYGLLHIDNCDIRKNGQHCIRAHADAGKPATFWVRRSDIAQVSLEGPWTVDIDDASNIPGGVTLDGTTIR